jgi:predicted RNA-binding protein with RPS1 domain
MSEHIAALESADTEPDVEKVPADASEPASTEAAPDAEPVAPPDEAPGDAAEPSAETAEETSPSEAVGDDAPPDPPAAEPKDEAAAPEPEEPEAAAEPPVTEAADEASQPEPEVAEAAAEPPVTEAADEASQPEPEVAEAAAEPPATEAADEASQPTQEAEAPAGVPPTAVVEGPVGVLLAARDEKTPVEGKVFGWNDRGFHVVIQGLTAFCPSSEMELGAPKAPASYVDQSFPFRILRVQSKGRRIVVSRAAVLRDEKSRRKAGVLAQLEVGEATEGTVSSITDFGAFVDLGGVEGLVHISEISRQRIEHPSEVLEVGQKIEVKVLRIEKKGRRISLSIKALEGDPWQAAEKRFRVGAEVKGKVEKTLSFGAFIELEPGLSGLLPTSEMKLPRGSSPGRSYPAGREVLVQIASVDSKRRRISLSLCGSKLEGSRSDYLDYVKKQKRARGGMNAMAAAFQKLKEDD